MIEKIDARLARLAARHTELSTLIQNASVELAQVEGAHAQLLDLKREMEAAATLPVEDAERVLTRAEAASVRLLHADDLEEQRTVTHTGAEEAGVFPVEKRLQRELARTAQVGAGPMASPEAERSE